MCVLRGLVFVVRRRRRRLIRHGTVSRGGPLRGRRLPAYTQAHGGQNARNVPQMQRPVSRHLPEDL